MPDALPVLISTDGACLGNPGPGGWGAILRYGEHEREISGAEPDTTNNRMELTAAIRALDAVTRPSTVILTLFEVATQVKQYKDCILLHLPTSCPVQALLQRITTLLTAIPVPALNTS